MGRTISSDGGDRSADPDLTPMLDLVLQILMFFITTTRLVEKEKNPEVDLPYSQAAVPLDPKMDKEYFFVTLYHRKGNEDNREQDIHEVSIGGGEKLDLEIRKHLAKFNSELKNIHDNRQLELGGGDKQVDTIVIIRAHKAAKYSEVYQLLQRIKDKGFTNLQIRTNTDIKARS